MTTALIVGAALLTLLGAAWLGFYLAVRFIIWLVGIE